MARTFNAPSRPGHRTVRASWFAFRFNVRVLAFVAVAALALTLLTLWAMTLGSLPLSFSEVMRATVGQGSDDTQFVVRTLRLPRVLSAVLIGISLAIAGAIFQGIARNPLVSPDIIGINSGATVCAVTWIIVGSNQALLPLAAFAGAIVTAAAIYGLSWNNGISTNRLILVGIGVGAVVSSGSTYMIVRFPIEQARPAIVWTMGSIYGSDWADVILLGGVLAVMTPLAVFLMAPLRVLQIGDVVTRSLGLSLERTRLSLMVVGCALAGTSVAIAGPIGFVALMVPHMARMIAGPQSGSVLLFTGVLGGIMLLASDVVAQHLLPVSLPVGVVTAAVGAPYFLFLLYRSNTRM